MEVAVRHLAVASSSRVYIRLLFDALESRKFDGCKGTVFLRLEIVASDLTWYPPRSDSKLFYRTQLRCWSAGCKFTTSSRGYVCIQLPRYFYCSWRDCYDGECGRFEAGDGEVHQWWKAACWSVMMQIHDDCFSILP